MTRPSWDHRTPAWADVLCGEQIAHPLTVREVGEICGVSCAHLAQRARVQHGEQIAELIERLHEDPEENVDGCRVVSGQVRWGALSDGRRVRVQLADRDEICVKVPLPGRDVNVTVSMWHVTAATLRPDPDVTLLSVSAAAESL